MKKKKKKTLRGTLNQNKTKKTQIPNPCNFERERESELV